MRKLNKNNGITLIALVISIIVMLILVAVSISMAVNGGLFNYAGKAVGDTQNAIDKEKELAEGRIKIGDTWYDSIDDYLKNKPSANQGNGTGSVEAVHNWTRGTGENVDTFTCSHCNKTYTMGQAVDLGETTLGETKYYESMLVSERPANSKSARTQAMSYGLVTGEETEWVVLGIEDTDKDGINETLLLTSSEPVKLYEVTEEETKAKIAAAETFGVYMKGAAAYNNGPEEVERMCKEIYSNTYGEARSMTIEDVNRALGYTPTDGIVYDVASGSYKYAKEMLSKGITEKKGFDVTVGELSIWDKIKNTGIYVPTENGKQDENALKATKVNGYFYTLNTDGTKLVEGTGEELDGGVTETEVKTIFGSSENVFYYWLASRFVFVSGRSSDAYAFFGPGVVDGGCAVSCVGFFGSDGFVYDRELALRPVVSLKSELPTTYAS